MHHDQTNTCDRSTGGKRPYATPALVCHGLIHNLTQSGSGADVETSTGNGGCSANTSKKSCIPSDVRLKRNIRRVGNYSKSISLYLFDYKPEFKASCGEGTYLGVMAQEVLPILPSAVVMGANGYYAVDYAELRQLRH